MVIVDGIPGWYSCPKFFQLAVDQAPNHATFVEAGVLFGSASQGIAKMIEASGKDIQLWMLDAFDESRLSQAARLIIQQHVAKHPPRTSVSSFRDTFEFFRRGRPHGADKHHVMQASSPQVAGVFGLGSLDLVFLDNTHATEHVVHEIEVWRRRVKPGGLLAGKRAGIVDGQFVEHPGIYAALDQVFHGKFETTGQTDWYVRV
jgi:predicted O-methyltransferase YrrM